MSMGFAVVAVAIIVCAIVFAAVFALGIRSGRRRYDLASSPELDTREIGNVEMDCRGCGQINRVSGQHLRDKPTCGRCKARLMPRKRITFSLEDPPWSDELAKISDDYERTWNMIADRFERLSTLSVGADQRSARDEVT